MCPSENVFPWPHKGIAGSQLFANRQASGAAHPLPKKVPKAMLKLDADKTFEAWQQSNTRLCEMQRSLESARRRNAPDAESLATVVEELKIRTQLLYRLAEAAHRENKAAHAKRV
jgi:hypothetical protein